LLGLSPGKCKIKQINVQYNTVHYSTAQFSPVQYSSVQYSTVLYSTVQHSTVQYAACAHLLVKILAMPEHSAPIVLRLFCGCNPEPEALPRRLIPREFRQIVLAPSVRVQVREKPGNVLVLEVREDCEEKEGKSLEESRNREDIKKKNVSVGVQVREQPERRAGYLRESFILSFFLLLFVLVLDVHEECERGEKGEGGE